MCVLHFFLIYFILICWDIEWHSDIHLFLVHTLADCRHSPLCLTHIQRMVQRRAFGWLRPLHRSIRRPIQRSACDQGKRMLRRCLCRCRFEQKFPPRMQSACVGLFLAFEWFFEHFLYVDALRLSNAFCVQAMRQRTQHADGHRLAVATVKWLWAECERFCAANDLLVCIRLFDVGQFVIAQTKTSSMEQSVWWF